MSDLGPVDNTCFARVRGGHCPDRPQCVMLDRAPGPRLVFGSELMSELDDEKGIYLETHAKHLDEDLISITVDHVGASVRRAAGGTDCCRCGGRTIPAWWTPSLDSRYGRTSGHSHGSTRVE